MAENLISKIKVGNTEYGLETTIANVNGLQTSLDNKISCTEQALDDAQKVQARANIGAGTSDVKSWSELEGKPVVMASGGDTLTWDGDTEGKVCASGAFYKISDVVVPDEYFTNNKIFNARVYDSETDSIRDLPPDANFITKDGEHVYILGEYVVMFVQEDNAMAELAGFTFPEKGIYFVAMGAKDEDFWLYPTSLTIPGYNFTQEKIAPSHLYQPDWNQNDESAPDYVKNRPFYTTDPVETTVFEIADHVFSDSMGVGMGIEFIEFDNIDTNDIQSCVVTFDGNRYECVTQIVEGVPVWGNLSILGNGDNTNEPFCLALTEPSAFMLVVPDMDSSHSVKIVLNIYTHIKIDSKYLPTIIGEPGTGMCSEVFNTGSEYVNVASGDFSHAEGYTTTAGGDFSHAEGYTTTASGNSSHAEGSGTIASGDQSHAEGAYSVASGMFSHAEGGDGDVTPVVITGEAGALVYTIESGAHRMQVGRIINYKATYASIVEYDSSTSTITVSNTLSSNEVSGGYAMVLGNVASGQSSHAEGSNTIASGQSSHAEGSNTIASGIYSHAEGLRTVASGGYQHVQGQWNIEDVERKYAHIVGNGSTTKGRSNAHTLDWSGNAWFAGDVYVGGTSQDDAVKLPAFGETGEGITPLEEKYLPSPDWNKIENKPFETVGGDTLTWDGDVTGKVSVVISDGSTLLKISDTVPTIDDFTEGASATFADGNSEVFDYEMLSMISGEDGFISAGFFTVIPTDNYSMDLFGITGLFPEKGIYFIDNQTSLTIPGYTGFTTEKIKQDALPEALQFGTVYGDTLAWEFNYSQLDFENLPGGMFVKVSDAIVTAEDMSNGCTIEIYGEPIDFPADEIMPMIDGVIALPDLMAVFVDAEGVGVDIEGIMFPQSGVYVLFELTPGKLSIPGFANFASTNKIDNKYLPDTCTEQIVLYTASESGVNRLYKDAACTEKLTRLEMLDIRSKNLHVIIHSGDTETYTPSEIVTSSTSGGAYMSIVTIDDLGGINGHRLWTAEYTGS